MKVRKHADWMGILDDRTLEFLTSVDDASVAEIQRGLAERGAALDHRHIFISIRCDLLADAGLLEFNSDFEEYSITELGKDYLRGEVDADDIEADQAYLNTRNIDFMP